MRLASFLPPLLLLSLASASLPSFSWSTVPVFWHACNFSGTLSAPLNAAAASFVASHAFASATVEKGQGLNGGDVGSFAEQRILAAARQLKAAAASAGRALATVAYFNSVLDWPYYALHADMLSHPGYSVKNASGTPVRLHGDESFPQPPEGMLVFDFAQADVRSWYASACAALVASGDVDGCFQDRAGAPALPGVRNASAYNAGHDAVLVAAQARLPDGFIIANGHVPSGAPTTVRATMIEFFAADEASIEALRGFAAAGLIVHAHANSRACGAGAGFTSLLAAFLIGAGRASYFACSHGWQVDPRWPAPGADDDWLNWPADYDRPLGAPCGDAVKLADRWTRAFGDACRTHVAFNTTTNEGTIEWGA